MYTLVCQLHARSSSSLAMDPVFFLSIYIANYYLTREASLIAQLVKNLPAMQETWVRFLGWEGPLKKGQATHSSILAWRIPWTI